MSVQHYRVLLVMLMSFAATAVMAATASALPIGNVQINGAAPNQDGSGLQASATFQSAQLTVTNNSSSYTDIKEVDGQANATNPKTSIGGATTVAPQDQTTGADTCSVDAGGGSFTCPGLAVAPGESVNIFLRGTPAQGACCSAGLAFINVVYDSVEVNGSPMNGHGKGLQVTAITTKGSCPELGFASAWCLIVVNSPNSGAQLGDITISANSPPAGQSGGQFMRVRAGFGFGVGPDTSNLGCSIQGSANCTAPFGVSPQEYGIDFASGSCNTISGTTPCAFSGALGDIAVHFPQTPCINNNAASASAPLARAADACTPPSHTKITQASVNHKKHTAFFKFKAKRTNKFMCELTRNGQRISYKSCKSPKPYAGHLKKGHYVFYVDGTNKGGVDPKPARFKFKL